MEERFLGRIRGVFGIISGEKERVFPCYGGL